MTRLQDWDILGEIQLEENLEGPAAISWRGDGKHFATLTQEHLRGETQWSALSDDLHAVE